MNAKRKYAFDPDYAVPPGETLKEVIASLGMTQKEMALRTGLTVQSLSRIAKGKQPITYETANLFELVTGVPASLWNNLEAQYREQLAKLDERERMKGETDWLKEVPYKELVDRGFVEANDDEVQNVRAALAFYGVGSVSAWRSLWENPRVSARRSMCFASHPARAAAWLRMGEVLAMDVACAPFEKERFLEVLEEAKAFTSLDPAAAVPRVQEQCASCGVAVVLVPGLTKLPWNGATKWLSPDKAMVILNLRGKREDKFWFTFFHEAGHILHDGKKNVFINDGNAEDEREKRADAFAATFLIPREFEDEIVAASTMEEIRGIAARLGVSPGIVAGRYQFLTKEWSRFNRLIRKVAWADSTA